MKKAITVGVIAAIIVVLAILSMGSFSISENPTKSTSDDFEDEIEKESEPQGRNISIELEEEMGFSGP